MHKIYNFSPGPAVLPEPVMEQITAELPAGLRGMSPLSVSHRGPEFTQIAERSESNLRALLQIPAEYQVLFVAGGASTHFGLVPLNLLEDTQSADYVITGHWGVRAYQEAKNLASVRLAADVSGNPVVVPAVSEWAIDPTAAYLHYTSNETVDGVQFPFIPDVPVPLVVDCSSDFLSQPLDVSRFAVLYAGAQKNIGPAGLSIVIIHRDFLGKNAGHQLPALCRYATYAQTGSMWNTPPTFAWYVVDLVLQWLQREGGLNAVAARNRQKAGLLYRAIDASQGFYTAPVEQAFRSQMNAVFYLPNVALERAFLSGAELRGLMNLKGHAIKGGIRASIYNAMPESGVQALVDWMAEFQRTAV